MRYKLKITPKTPKNESGLTQMKMIGKSIRLIHVWVNERVRSKTVVSTDQTQSSPTKSNNN